MNIIHRGKDLDKQACKFTCPNLSLIDRKGKELQLKEETIERAKNMATEYFRRTYRIPRYSSSRYLLPAFLYIASKFEKERLTQFDIEKAFGISSVTIRKWYKDIADVLNIKITKGPSVVIFSER